MRVGFIGLGTMGGSMALNAQKGGHTLVVHDMRKEAATRHVDAGARWADTVAEVGRSSEVVLTSLPGPKEVEAVAEGLIDAMPAGSAWFDLSTNSPTVVRRLHERFAKKGIAVLDAPVSGGPSGAKSGKLALWVGGERDVVRPVPRGARCHRRPGALYRPDRRRLGREARAQLRRLRDAARAGRSVHDGRQGRRRAARAVGRDTPGRAGPQAHVRPHRRSVPAGQVRSARLRARARAQGRDARDGARAAKSACRCGLRTSPTRK